jgi:hypothetical protein
MRNSFHDNLRNVFPGALARDSTPLANRARPRTPGAIGPRADRTGPDCESRRRVARAFIHAPGHGIQTEW